MAIEVGDKIPDVEVKVLGEDGMPASVSTAEILGSGKVVLFAVPGAFTPGCSKVHLPGFVSGAEALAGKGVTTVACVGVNDAWVMDAWAEAQGAKGKITMLADGNGAFTAAMGLAFDGLNARQTADHLGISHRTVSKHLQRGYRTLGVSTRMRALAVLREARPA